jgi:hypothetical protein
MTDNLQAAIALASAGLHILPCRADKKPAPGFMWQQWATNDPLEIEAIWNHYGADCMPALHVGRCGLIVIDVDRHADKDGVIIDGVGAFDTLLNQYGELPYCPAVETPSAGYHLFFKQPSDRSPLGNAEGALPKGVNIRGNGGYIIGVGAVRPDDGRYYGSVAGWPNLLESFVAKNIPVIPSWLVDLLEGESYEAPVCGPCVEAEPIADTRARAIGLGSLEKWSNTVARTGEGGRNNALNGAVFTLAGNSVACHLTESEVFAAMQWACTQNGYLQSRDPSDGPVSFTKTFRSAWRAGLRRPLSAPRDAAPASTINLKPKTK